MSGIRIPLNLASEPFHRDRPLLAASAATAVLLIGLLAVLVNIIVQEREAAKESRESMARLERQLASVNREIAALEGELRQPGNAAVLDRSVFLNVLIQRKGVSWTKLFEDLETVVPGNVRLVSVRPYLINDNDVQLDMVVGAQTQEPVIDLLRRLEGSKYFGATLLLSSQPPSQNEPLYRYRVSVSYAQTL